MGTNFGGVHVGCHCWVPLLGVIAGVPSLGCHCWMLATNLGGCHCWVPLLGCHCWVPLCGAMAGCHHCWMLAEFTIAGCHAGVPLLGAIARKIDQSVTVTPFSAAPFSTLIAHKLACAIWGLCWYIFSISSICKYVECMRIIYTSTVYHPLETSWLYLPFLDSSAISFNPKDSGPPKGVSVNQESHQRDASRCDEIQQMLSSSKIGFSNPEFLGVTP